MIAWDNGKGREEVKNELLSDFHKCMAKIDFANYRPSSEVFMSALSVGLLWHLISEMEKAEKMEKSMPQTAMR